MNTADPIAEGARPGARVLLFDGRHRLLLLKAAHPSGGLQFWVTPGGGLESGEEFEEAARRELLEETGLDLPIGPCVWIRRHVYSWNGQWHDQYERFFVARTDQVVIQPRAQDRYVMSHRWWTLQAIQASSEVFAPRRLGELGADIANGQYPEQPFDCGV
jgi:8-oxo-dGTP pyrophosphatase MutT (NUDIX family)